MLPFGWSRSGLKRALKEKEEQEKLENKDERAQEEAEAKKKLEAVMKKQQ